MLQPVVFLVLVNLGALIAIGLLTQQNPLNTWILSLLAGVNVVGILMTAVVSHDNSLQAVRSLAANLAPFVVVVAGLALVLLCLRRGAGAT